ncbi:MAG: hypothetical protein H6Q74_2185 [Firmicutes bacterium]|nr:hypothetical protein [Bacillota bacterium]
MPSLNFYSAYQKVIYIIVHYCTFSMIVTCIIAAAISWRLYSIESAQTTDTGDAYLAWWTTVIWGSIVIIFVLIGVLYT